MLQSSHVDDLFGGRKSSSDHSLSRSPLRAVRTKFWDPGSSDSGAGVELKKIFMYE